MKVIKSIKDLTGQDLGYGIEEMETVRKEAGSSEKKSSSRSVSSSKPDKPKAPVSEKSVLSRLQNQCSKREFCRSDIFQKAKKAMEGDAAAAERIVDALVKEKYVDDLRYASAFARVIPFRVGESEDLIHAFRERDRQGYYRRSLGRD